MTLVPAAADFAHRLGQSKNHDALAARNARLKPGDTITVRVDRSGDDGGTRYQIS